MRGLEWSRSGEILLDLLASEAAWKAIKAYNARASKCLASPSLAGKPADPCSVHVHKRFACTRWPKNALGSFVANVSMTLDLKQIARGLGELLKSVPNAFGFDRGERTPFASWTRS